MLALIECAFDLPYNGFILGNIARRLAAGRVNISLAYLATSTRLVLGEDDLEAARSILKVK